MKARAQVVNQQPRIINVQSRSDDDPPSSLLSFTLDQGNHDEEASGQIWSLNSRERLSSEGQSRRTLGALEVLEPDMSISRRSIIKEVLEEMTVNKLRFNKDQLYGREEEIRTLQSCLDDLFLTSSNGDRISNNQEENFHGDPLHRSLHRRNPRLVLIGGSSGTGKSVLAGVLKPKRGIGTPMNVPRQQQDSKVNTPCRRHHFYVQGKFDLQRNEPYSAIIDACHDLAQQIVHTMMEDGGSGLLQTSSTSNKEGDDCRRVLPILGEHERRILIDFVPALASILLLDNNDHDGGSHDRDSYVEGRGCRSSNSGGNNTTNIAPATATQETKNRFHYAFLRFLRAVGSCLCRPVVVVVDDIQWADRATLELLDVLLADHENPSLLIVCCYRNDDELEDRHPHVFDWIRELTTGDTTADNVNTSSLVSETTTTISLGNLSLKDTNALLADALSVQIEETGKLATIVQRKTLGNPFFVVQFLCSIYERELLDYSLGLTRWIWDENEIESATTATDNVVDLIVFKMKELPSHVRRVLSLAACVGSNFSKEILSKLDERIKDDWADLGLSSSIITAATTCSLATPNDDMLLDIVHWLEMAVNKGVLEHHGAGSYRFIHDKIQEAAVALIPIEMLPTFQFRIGKVLSMMWTEQIDGVDVFVAVDFLNAGYENGQLQKQHEHIELAELNMEAGRRAIVASAFHQGAEYLQKGIALLPDHHWEDHYDLSLELFSSAAEAENCIGDVANVEEHCKQVIGLSNAPIRDKFRVYNVLVDSIGHRNELNDAISLILSILSQLGCRLPKFGKPIFVLAGLLRAKVTLKQLTPQQIATLPLMEDECQIEVMMLLDKLVTYAYLSKSDLLPLAILKGLRWTLQNGVCEFSPPSFVLVGLLLSAHLGDLHGGSRYARLGLSMLPLHANKAAVSRTLFTAHVFVLHATDPAHTCMKPLLRSYQIGMASGDLESAMWSILFYIDFGSYSGLSLESIQNDYLRYSQQMLEFKIMKCYGVALVFLQGVQLLTRRTNAGDIKGEIMVKNNVVREAETGNPLAQVVFRRWQIQLSSIFCEYEVGSKLALQYGESYPSLNHGQSGSILNRLHSAICCFAMARSSITGPKKKYLNYAMKNRRIIQGWVRNGNPNMTHYASLLDAEFAAYHKKKFVAKDAYETSVLKAARKGFIHDQALANERFADFMLVEMQDEDEAKFRIREAFKLYQEWGAHAKVYQMREKYAFLVDGLS